jgi:Flp pilus assembly protein TadD
MNLIADTFEAALGHHKAGRIGVAAALYGQILERTPNHADSLHLLGTLAYEAGRHAAARALIGKALALRPRFAEAHNNLGLVHQAEQDCVRACACHENAIAICADFPEAHNNLGIALQKLGRLADAAAAFERASSLKPDYHEAVYNLGNVRRAEGDLAAAATAFRRAIALRPDAPHAHNNLGNALQQAGRLVEARACYERALALRPGHLSALNNLGNVCRAEGKFAEARTLFERALALKPAYADAHNNLAIVLRLEGRFAGALVHYDRAVALTPNAAGPHNNRGNLLQDLGRLDEAATSFERALALEPDFPAAHHNLGMALLAAGRFEAGWREYEWRWRTPQAAGLARRFAEPPWRGEPLSGGTLLIHAEQGFGDTLQFCRYVPLLARRGHRIVLEVPSPLMRLMGSLAGVADGGIEIVAQGDALPPFDRHCPLLSLPLACGTRLDTIPSNGPYLAADPAAREAWRQRLAADGPELKVGLVWSGNPRADMPELAAIDRRRSIAVDLLAPLATCPGVRFYSLQKQGDPAPPGLGLVDAMAEMRDFADTAALVANLDLVISVDTAVAHLAGALGRPVWLLNRFDNCWRWLAGRDDSPWYPTLRLFRQSRPGDWTDVIARVGQALAARATGASR